MPYTPVPNRPAIQWMGTEGPYIKAIPQTIIDVDPEKEFCKYCVEMTESMRDMEQELIGLRKVHVTLRASNTALRRRINALQDQADAIFKALCEVSVSVEDSDGRITEES